MVVKVKEKKGNPFGDRAHSEGKKKNSKKKHDRRAFSVPGGNKRKPLKSICSSRSTAKVDVGKRGEENRKVENTKPIPCGGERSKELGGKRGTQGQEAPVREGQPGGPMQNGARDGRKEGETHGRDGPPQAYLPTSGGVRDERARIRKGGNN